MTGTYSGNTHGGTLGYIWLYLHVCYSNRGTAGTSADGGRADAGRPSGRRTGGYPGGRYGAMSNGRVACMPELWGKGGHGGSPNAEAGKAHCVNTYAAVLYNIFTGTKVLLP